MAKNTTHVFGQHTATIRRNKNGSVDWLLTRDDGSQVVVWYNFTTRDWVVMLECNGGQCGASEYVYRKYDIQFCIDTLDHDSYCTTPQGEAQRVARRAALTNRYGI